MKEATVFSVGRKVFGLLNEDIIEVATRISAYTDVDKALLSAFATTVLADLMIKGKVVIKRIDDGSN